MSEPMEDLARMAFGGMGHAMAEARVADLERQLAEADVAIHCGGKLYEPCKDEADPCWEHVVRKAESALAAERAAREKEYALQVHAEAMRRQSDQWTNEAQAKLAKVVEAAQACLDDEFESDGGTDWLVSKALHDRLRTALAAAQADASQEKEP